MVDSLNQNDYFLGMDRNRAGILYGCAFLLASLIMAGWHWVLTGISTDFGAGAVVGFAFAYGILAILSRKVREL